MQQPARFLDLQRAFYRGDPNYVPPMTFAERWQVDRRRNPFFDHAEAEFLVAWRDQRPVGRISAVRDRFHDDFHGDRVGFFGHFEAADEEAAHRLLDVAADWLRLRGARSLRGPVDLSTNYRCGLLIDGKPGPPVLMMPYNPKHYADWLQSYGLRGAKDLLALTVRQDDLDLPRLRRVSERLLTRNPVSIRKLRLRDFRAEVQLLWELYNQIWEKNWGFVPMSEDEFQRQAKDFRRIAVSEISYVAELDGKAVGFIIGLPDVNIPTRACNGRLLPLGWLRFLRSLRQVRSIRVLTLGVLPGHRNSGLEMLLMNAVIQNGMASGYSRCEASWILEDNENMLGPLKTLGFRPYRRYRIFEKNLA